MTIFPRMLEGPLSDGIVQRARDASLVEIHVHDLRDFTDDRHRSVDDAPFGGGPGMVMKAEPFFRAVESVRGSAPAGSSAVVLLSPRGRRFDQETARRYAQLDHLLLLCGRYEGIDERVAEVLASEELSLGDFVLTGGETAALAVIEAVVRLLPGALGDEGSAESDSFEGSLLDWPHYTRPAEWRGHAVPEVLRLGRPRSDPALAPQGIAARDARAAAGPAGRRRRSAPRTRCSCERSKTKPGRADHWALDKKAAVLHK